MNVIKKKREEVDACSVADVDVRWRVLKGKKVDTSDCGGLRTLLSKAVAIFHVSICNCQLHSIKFVLPNTIMLLSLVVLNTA